ncbi:MAG TPA: ABC transporter ATP-binding protein [Patescibacteria group bacterium]|nr:ABC transporter ATP-binding protein [Patescibacteria group bacterium]
MLDLQRICFGYSNNIMLLKELNLHISAGEFIVVAGRNGSGKTTLTKLMMGLLKPTTGHVLFEGEDVTGQGADRMARHVGYVFQNPDRQMFRDTVGQEVAYGPEQLGFETAATAAAVEEALRLTDLTDLAGVYPRTLSKGRKQRVAIASALAMKPRLLILDEPTSGQDAGQREQLLSVMTRLNRQGMTIMLVTHDMEILTRYASRVLVVGDAGLAFDGMVETLFNGDYPLAQWGLSEPAIVKISRGLSALGVATVFAAEELQKNIQPLLRKGDGHEPHSTAH